jgi:hypothetical protein
LSLEGAEGSIVPIICRRGSSPCKEEPNNAPRCANNSEQINGCGAQWCLSNGTWSNQCARRQDIFPCAGGQVCGSDAMCH